MTWTSHMARNTDGSALTKGPVEAEPALLTRMAMGPRAASAAVTWRLTSAGLVTSATAHPAASPAATAACSGASVRPITVTLAPARASAAATARPMPRPPPVTKACVLASAIASISLRRSEGKTPRGPGSTGRYFRLKIFKLQACPAGYFRLKIMAHARGSPGTRDVSTRGAHEGSRDRRWPGRPLFRDPREEGLAAHAHHRIRAQPARRHFRLRRRVLRRDARHLRDLRPGELSHHRRPLRLLGRHRDPFPRHDSPHRRQRILRLLARDAAQDPRPAGARARRRHRVPAGDL